MVAKDKKCNECLNTWDNCICDEFHNEDETEEQDDE